MSQIDWAALDRAMRWWADAGVCRRTGLVLVFAAALCGLSGELARGEWKGTESTREGVLHVSNPETPSDGVVDVELTELWRLGGHDEEILFGVISQLVEDEERNIYLLDSQLHEIQVFSPEGTHLRTFGRQGEGPGEFNNPIDMFYGLGGVLGIIQVFPGKIAQLSKVGEPVGDFPLPSVEGGGIQLVMQARASNDLLLISGERPKPGEAPGVQQLYLKGFSKDGSERVRFHEATYQTRFGGMEFREEVWSNFTRRWDLAKDGRVASAVDFDAYQIHLWNEDGSLDRIIERPDYAAVTRTDDEVDQFQRFYDALTSWNPGSSFAVKKTHLTINQLQFRDDGSLWVLAADGLYRSADGVLAEYDVFDREGRYVRRVRFLAEGDASEDGIFFVGDRAYVVTELLSAAMSDLGAGDGEDGDEDAEPMTVIAYEAPALGSK